MNEIQIRNGLTCLEEEFGKTAVRSAIQAVQDFQVELPSWVFGEFGGGRFSGYMPPGFARTVAEKMDDAALVNQLTGATERIAVHMLWDFSSDGMEADYQLALQARDLANQRGLELGAINPTYFLNGSYRGSLSATEENIRKRYVDQTVMAAQLAGEISNKLVTVWLHDGSLYPGQINIGRAYLNVRDSLITAMEQIDKSVLVLVEYKLFEPGTYSTAIPDWGTAYMLISHLGENAGVLVDMGHHSHVTNIEQIVARLIAEGTHGGFHFNTRYAADDDHAVEPNFEMACIFNELVAGDILFNSDSGKNWPLMIDQCSGRENRMHAIIHSVDSLQHCLAKACLVDHERLQSYQDADEILLANRLVNAALLHADVRPIVAAARLEKNLPVDPVTAYVESGYQHKINEARK